MEENRCERCWTTTLAEKRMAEREDRCVVEKCTNIGAHKFFGHSICRKHTKRIPGPLEVYAASWIKAGEDIDTINEGLEKIFIKVEECKEVKGSMTTPIEWFYKWESRAEEPVLKSRTNLLFLPEEETIMGEWEKTGHTKTVVLFFMWLVSFFCSHISHFACAGSLSIRCLITSIFFSISSASSTVCNVVTCFLVLGFISLLFSILAAV